MSPTITICIDVRPSFGYFLKPLILAEFAGSVRGTDHQSRSTQANYCGGLFLPLNLHLTSRISMEEFLLNVELSAVDVCICLSCFTTVYQNTWKGKPRMKHQMAFDVVSGLSVQWVNLWLSWPVCNVWVNREILYASGTAGQYYIKNLIKADKMLCLAFFKYGYLCKSMEKRSSSFHLQLLRVFTYSVKQIWLICH